MITMSTAKKGKSKLNSISSSEQLAKELSDLSREILAKQLTEVPTKPKTEPSSLALSTTKHDSGEGIDRVKKSPRKLFILYLTNQYVSRAVNIRSDTLVSKGYKIVGNDKKGVTMCSELIQNSGGTNFFWQLGTVTDISGDGYLEPIYNEKRNKYLYLKVVHPLTLDFKKDDKTGKVIVDSNGTPVSYVQSYVDKDGAESEKEIPIDRIEHLRFNILGDEFNGISIIQSGYDTIVRLMNMEYSAAEAAIKTANPLWVAICNTKSPSQIAQWGTILGRITGKDQLFLPEGMDLKMMSPGQQNFSDYSEYFLNAVTATFGVPKSILLGESSSGNRAESVVLSRHFYGLIRSNQLYMEDFFNKIFKKYGKLAGFEPPKLVFGNVSEDPLVNVKSAIDLYVNGIITREESRTMLGFEKIGTSKDAGVEDSVANAVKKSDMETWHNNPGDSPGSQAGEKSKQIVDDFSETNPLTK